MRYGNHICVLRCIKISHLSSTLTRTWGSYSTWHGDLLNYCTSIFSTSFSAATAATASARGLSDYVARCRNREISFSPKYPDAAELIPTNYTIHAHSQNRLLFHTNTNRADEDSRQ